MSRVETIRPTYHTIQAWGSEFDTLNDPNLLADILKTVSEEAADTSLLCHSFKPFGVTAVILSPSGIFSGHHWPERNFGFYTCFSRDPRKSTVFSRVLAEKLAPNSIGDTRPLVNHLTARFTTQASELIDSPKLLLESGQQIATRSKLKAFSQPDRFLQQPQHVMAVVGLEASHLSLDVKMTGETTIDIASCDKNSDIELITASIKAVMRPTNRVSIGITIYPEDVGPIPSYTIIYKKGSNILLIQEIPLGSAVV